MGADKAVEMLRYMLFEVDGIESEISDEQCDLLIDIDDDPALAEKIRNDKLKEIKKAEEAEKKAEQKREAAAKKAAAAAARKEAAKQKAAQKAAEEAKKAAEAQAQKAAEQQPLVEIVEAPAEPVVEQEVQGPEPEAKPKEKHAPAVLAEILPEIPKEEKEQKKGIIIGSAIDHEQRTVEILRADGSRIDIPDAEAIGVQPLAEEAEEEEEEGLLAEAQRRQEEEERRRAKVSSRPLPEPDPAVVAEVIRKAAEKGQGLKKKKEQRGVKLQKIEKQDRDDGAEKDLRTEHVVQRRTGSTGKTARKRQKRAERERAEQTMRRDAAQAVREYQAGGIPGNAPKKKRRKRLNEGTGMEDIEAPEILEVQHSMTVEELANAMEVSVNEIILDLMDRDILAAKNQRLEIALIQDLAEQRGYEISVVIPEEVEVLAEEPDRPEDLKPRAPVITVMGHVDHGKTSLLDVVRSAHVAEGEAGGITQHIAAYNVPIKNGRVVFLDTPGHEAFTQMRARGSKATDIVVLVVAADDGVMPQTIEAIDHAKAAEVPIVVAINKCDKPDAQPEKIRQELTQFELVDEKWGGKTIMRNISAKTHEGVEELMEMLLLEAELLELKANPNKRGKGVVIESEITRGMGPVAWVLVREGTLRVGDVFLAGESFGRVRSLLGSHGEALQEAGPSMPVVVTGFSQPPEAGSAFVVVQDERVARSISEKRAEVAKQKQGAAARHITLEDFHERMLAGERQTLRVVVKADVQGSVDVLSSSLLKQGNDEVRVELVHAGVGGINESDVLLASASDAVIIGFHVTAGAKIKKLAEQEGVDIRTYRVIYEAISDVHAALEGMLKPESKEIVVGHAEIRAVFRSSAIGSIAGCQVQDGEIVRGARARLLRDGAIVYEGKVGTLKRNKDDARTVTAGLECGIKLENYEDIKEGDIIETFKIEEVAKVLA